MGRTAGTVLGLAAALALTTGCDSAGDAVGGAVSSATAAVASAAERKMDEVRDGVDAKGDVRAGEPRADGDRTVAEITATNPKDGDADYTVMVDFRDGDGKLLDAVVLDIDAVAPGKSKSGTARSNRRLPGATKAEIGRALRH
ncbi:hypothetical protein [Streptomyces sp. NPDC088915]|uniref:hypothetical protein n=1 Tax=Streptomyces sp. NPDC088915 TaxID=3365912 RepID=UPI003821F8BE